MTDRAKRGACSAGSGIVGSPGMHCLTLCGPRSSPHDTIPSPLGLCVGSKTTPGWASRSPIVLSHAYLLIQKKIPPMARSARWSIAGRYRHTQKHNPGRPRNRQISHDETAQCVAVETRVRLYTNECACGRTMGAGGAEPSSAPTAHTSQSSCGRGAGKETKERLCSSLI